MGEVFRAFDERLNRWVAVKQLLPEAAAEAVPRERFRREARSVARLNHPVVVQIYDILRDETGHDWIVMELVEGRPLKDIVADGPLEPLQAISLGRQLAEGLAAAHERGIVHRDLKIENVMVTPEGRAKILDFGLAKSFDQDPQAESISSSGNVLGTSRAMSPEQAMGLTVDQRSDLFSLGVLLFEIVTGESPFRAATPIFTLARVCHHQQPPARELAPRVSPALSHLVDELLEKDPEDRPQSARQVAAALAALARREGEESGTEDVPFLVVPLGSLQEGASKPGAGRRFSLGRRATLAALLIGAFLLAVGFFFLGHHVGDEARRSAPSTLAVLGFDNLASHPEDEWLATGLVELLNAELAAGGELRLVPAAEIELMRRELGVEGSKALRGETLEAVRRRLGADYVVLGSYMLLAEPNGKASLTVLPVVQDTRDGEAVLALHEEVPYPAGMRSLVVRVGDAVRSRLGVTLPEDAAAEHDAAVRAALPAAPVARRHYASGLERLRRLDARGALDELEKAVAIEPGYAPAHMAIAEAWDALGYEAEARRAARRAAAHAAALPRREQLLIEACGHELHGRWAAAVEVYEILWGFFPSRLDYGLRLANALRKAGELGEARAMVDVLRELPEATGDPRLDLLAARLAVEPGRALDQARRAAGRARERGTLVLAAEASRVESEALIRTGQPVAAAQKLEEARRLLHQTGERRREAEATGELGLLAADRGELARAEAFLRRSLALHRELGHRGGLARTMLQLGYLMERQGSLAAAAEYLTEALEHATAIGDSHLLARGHEGLAWVRAGQGQLAAARRLIAELADAPTDARLVVGRELVAGEVALVGGEMARARAAFKSALQAAREARASAFSGLAYDRLGQVDLLAGDFDDARICFSRAAAIRADMRVEGSLAVTRLARARLLLAEGSPEEAIRVVDAATGVFERQGRHDDLLRAAALRLEIELARGRNDAAEQGLAEVSSRAAASENLALQIEVEILAARIHALTTPRQAAATLHRAASRAGQLELAGLELLARLTAAEIEAGLGLPGSAERLARYRQEAEEKGFGLWTMDSSLRRVHHPPRRLPIRGTVAAASAAAPGTSLAPRRRPAILKGP